MVPVIDSQQKPLMPCSEKRARKMVAAKAATPFWKHGVWCIRLNKEPSARNTQIIVVGIDPGSKREGFTVKSKAHTLLNLNVEAITWVRARVEAKRNMRRARRLRNTPCRVDRMNRARPKSFIPPSTKARWGWKLRLLSWLSKMYPITDVVVEDIAAVTKKGKRRWNKNFSPLEVGKNWFYDQVRAAYRLSLKSGWETKQIRDNLGLKKTKQKLAEVFSAHCVDSWAIANDLIKGHLKPENERILCVAALQLHRRQLHRMVPSKGNIRKRYGGTRSLGFKRGSLVQHPKWGLSYVGGHYESSLSLHCLKNGKRLSFRVKPEDCEFKARSSFRVWDNEKEKENAQSIHHRTTQKD